MPKILDIPLRDRVIGDINLSKVIRTQSIIVDWDTVMQDLVFGTISLLGMRLLLDKNSAFNVYNPSLLNAITFDYLKNRSEQDIFLWLEKLHIFNKIQITREQTEACRKEFISIITDCEDPILLEISPLTRMSSAICELYKNDYIKDILILLTNYEWYYLDYISQKLMQLFPKKSNLEIKIDNNNDDTLDYICSLAEKCDMDNHAVFAQNDVLLLRSFDDSLNERLRGMTFIAPKVGYSKIDEQMMAYFNARSKYNEYVIYENSLMDIANTK